jgi:hypothetical protein
MRIQTHGIRRPVTDAAGTYSPGTPRSRPGPRRATRGPGAPNVQVRRRADTFHRRWRGGGMDCSGSRHMCGRASTRRASTRRAHGYVPSGKGIVAEEIHSLHELVSPSSQVPSVATGKVGTAFPSTNEIPMYSPTM